MQLVYRKDRSGWVVDCCRKGFQSDIDENAGREKRVLLQGSFGAEHDCPNKSPITNLGGATIQMKERFIVTNKVSHLWDQLDDSSSFLGLLEEGLRIDGQN